MLRKYRKSPIVEAERFDGSDEMIERYSVHVFNSNLAKNIFFIGMNVLAIGDWIVKDEYGNYQVVADDIFRKSYERCE